MFKFFIFVLLFQSLIRTAEQLKIKGLCEINDHTNTESDTEAYPPHKKIRASRHFESNGSSNNASIGTQEDKRKSKSPYKDTNKNNSSSNGNRNSNKNMASLEMGMVS